MRSKVTRKFLGGLALAAACALTGGVAVARQQQQSPAQAQDGRGRAERPWGPEGGKGRRGGGHFGGGAFRGIDLTDAQREQLRQIAERYRATFEARHARGERRPAFDPLAGGAFDEAAVRAAAQARASEQVEREVAHARMMHEMYNVLTPEQKAQLASERQQREQRRGQRRQQFRTRRGAPQGTQPQ